jgi:DNA-binding NarL/FixJ family response regulator
MRVFLVDPQPVFREGLKSILGTARDLTVIGEADRHQDVVDKIQRTDVLVLDGELDALSLLRTLDKPTQKGRPPYILILSNHPENRHAIQLLEAGADGYVNKSKPPDQIIEAIRKVSRGGKYISKELAEAVVVHLDHMKKPARLSGREYQVLCLFASGLCMTEIAERLTLSVKTISTYRSRLLEKLDLRTNAELMRYAFKEGLVT